MSSPSDVMFSGLMPGSREAPEGVPRSRFNDQATSSAVTGEPSWNVAPSARVKRQVLRSSDAFQEVARRGAVLGLVPGTVSVSCTSEMIR